MLGHTDVFSHFTPESRSNCSNSCGHEMLILLGNHQILARRKHSEHYLLALQVMSILFVKESIRIISLKKGSHVTPDSKYALIFR
jgi:hypothetical protein